MNVLIIGGSSGLGLALAQKLVAGDNQVVVTGRTDPKQTDITFKKFDLVRSDLPGAMEQMMADLPKIDLLVYAAGFFQEGRVTDLSPEQIEAMIDVGGRGLIYALRAILNKQNELSELVTITSTSEWTPRQYEPVYNFVKAGGGLLTNAIAEDGRVGKVMVAGPAGMNTAFWREQPGRDKSKMLDPDWVADQILKFRADDYKFKYIRVLRDPPRVEEISER